MYIAPTVGTLLVVGHPKSGTAETTDQTFTIADHVTHT
ncbi:hypothetical protein ABIE27_000345 [Paenibacillus sp. 4624]